MTNLRRADEAHATSGGLRAAILTFNARRSNQIAIALATGTSAVSAVPSHVYAIVQLVLVCCQSSKSPVVLWILEDGDLQILRRDAALSAHAQTTGGDFHKVTSVDAA